jgi:hypothetical protein
MAAKCCEATREAAAVAVASFPKERGGSMPGGWWGPDYEPPRSALVAAVRALPLPDPEMVNYGCEAGVGWEDVKEIGYIPGHPGLAQHIEAHRSEERLITDDPGFQAGVQAALSIVEGWSYRGHWLAKGIARAIRKGLPPYEASSDEEAFDALDVHPPDMCRTIEYQRNQFLEKLAEAMQDNATKDAALSVLNNQVAELQEQLLHIQSFAHGMSTSDNPETKACSKHLLDYATLKTIKSTP